MSAHGTFELELDIPAPPDRVFAAFAEPELRVRWFRVPGPSASYEHSLDFRVGGGETARNRFVLEQMDERVEYRSRFLDLVPDERLCYVYEGLLDDELRWASLVTVRLAAEGGGTRLTWTEQYSYLRPSAADGEQDAAHLRGGIRLMLNGLFAVATGGTVRGRPPRTVRQ